MTADADVLTPEAVRHLLRTGGEVALLDVREEAPYAEAHPLFAAQLSAGRIELEAPWRLPRRDVTVAVYDDGDGLAAPAADALRRLGYTRVHRLDGGLAGWRNSGGELFRDVNVPSKAFGELVEHECRTPSLPAAEVKALLDRKANVAVLDVRRFDEYSTMCVPTAVSVPGAELVLRVRDLVPDPDTLVVVNCAGRTRSIIGTQSLVNAGVPNRVAALRNGTIGWILAGFPLDRGRTRRFSPVADTNLAAARRAAGSLADRAGAIRLDAGGLAGWESDHRRTLYRWDVRTPEEYAAGHLPGFGSAPGGQLVQETDVYAAVRGARVVVADCDGVRAAMTAHWLAQMGWEVGWLADPDPAAFTEPGPWRPPHAPRPAVPIVTPVQLAGSLADGRTRLFDVATSTSYAKGHIPGAEYVLRTQLPQELERGRPPCRVVVTSDDGTLADFAVDDLTRHTQVPASALAGGTAAWAAEGRPLDRGADVRHGPPVDRYRRPYEGTDAPREAMRGYLDWEFGLVAQLGRDGTHGFRVLR